jgi:alkylhydroperoxidase family enzyme
MAGIRDDEMIAIRKPGVASSKLQVLGGFARAVVQKRGYVSDDELEQVKEAGYTDAAVTEAIMVIALTTFTNFFNHVNKTVVDFPAAPGL